MKVSNPSKLVIGVSLLRTYLHALHLLFLPLETLSRKGCSQIHKYHVE
jgi:hypothetical protein